MFTPLSNVIFFLKIIQRIFDVSRGATNAN